MDKLDMMDDQGEIGIISALKSAEPAVCVDNSVPLHGISESFAAIEFKEERTIAAVPCSWFVDASKTKVFYPPDVSRANKYAKKGKKPCADWNIYDVIAIRIFDSFEGATQMCAAMSDIGSDAAILSKAVESVNRNQKRVAKAPQRLTDTSDDEGPPVVSKKKKTVPKPPSISKESNSSPTVDMLSRSSQPARTETVTTPTTPMLPRSPQSARTETVTTPTTPMQPRSSLPARTETVTTPTTPMLPRSSQPARTQTVTTPTTPTQRVPISGRFVMGEDSDVKLIIDRIQLMEQNLIKHIDQELAKSKEKVSRGPQILTDIFPNMPFQTAQDMADATQDIHDRDVARQLSRVLIETTPAANVEEFIHKSMVALASNLVLSGYNWKGTRKGDGPSKDSFERHPLCNVLFHAAQKKFKNANPKVIKNTIQINLKNAPNRSGGARKVSTSPEQGTPRFDFRSSSNATSSDSDT